MKKLWKVMSVLLCGAMLLTGCGNTKVAQNNGTIEEEKDSVYTTFSDIKNSGDLIMALDEPTAKGILVDPKEEFESNAYKEGM